MYFLNPELRTLNPRRRNVCFFLTTADWRVTLAMVMLGVMAGCREKPVTDAARDSVPGNHQTAPSPARAGSGDGGGSAEGRAVPAADPTATLLAAALASDPEDVDRALRALAATGDRYTEVVAGWLTNPDPAVARLGVRALAAIGTKSALMALFDQLAKLPADSPQAWEWASILADEAPSAQRDLLLEWVLDPAATEPLRDAAQRALARDADAALANRLVTLYDSASNDAARQALADALRQMQNPELVDELVRLAFDRAGISDPMTVAIWDTLGIIGTPEAVTALAALLASSALSAADRAALADALARVDNLDALPLLRALAAGQVAGAGPTVQAAAHRALANFPGE
jgi:hypothetical protein